MEEPAEHEVEGEAAPTPKVINNTELEDTAMHEVEDETTLIAVLSEDIMEEATKALEKTSKILNSTELEETAKHEVEDETILTPVLSEDITEEAVKRLEETPRVLNTPELEEPAEHEVELVDDVMATSNHIVPRYAALDFGPLDFGTELFQEVIFGNTKNTVPNIKPRPGDGRTPLNRPANRQYGLPPQSGLAMPSAIYTRVDERARPRVNEHAETSGDWDPSGGPVKPQDFRPVAWWG